MSEELEAAGALTTAGLAAASLPQAAGPHTKGTHESACRNCGATLTGSYCSACGQPAHLHRSLLHLGEEVLHGLYHFDAKGWRTLPLLVAKPGVLTRRYIDGQRVRYVSPLALFLFTVFLMFLVFSFTSGSPDGPPNGMSTAGAPSREELNAELAKAQTQVAKARAALEKAKQRGEDVEEATDELNEAISEEKALMAASSVFSHAPSTPGSGAAKTKIVSKGWRQVLRNTKFDSDIPGLNAAMRRAVDNPDLTLYKLKNTAYKFSFLLVPISLPFLWLMFFWRRGIAMYDHAVFTLYSLSFMSLLLIAAALLSAAHVPAGLVELLTFVPPVHMFLQLRSTYGLSTFSALWRTFAMVIAAAVVLTFFMLIIITATMS